MTDLFGDDALPPCEPCYFCVMGDAERLRLAGVVCDNPSMSGAATLDETMRPVTHAFLPERARCGSTGTQQ